MASAAVPTERAAQPNNILELLNNMAIDEEAIDEEVSVAVPDTAFKFAVLSVRSRVVFSCTRIFSPSLVTCRCW